MSTKKFKIVQISRPGTPYGSMERGTVVEIDPATLVKAEPSAIEIHKAKHGMEDMTPEGLENKYRNLYAIPYPEAGPTGPRYKAIFEEVE